MNIPTRTARRIVATVTALMVGLALPALAGSAASVPPQAAGPAPTSLTNLDHLDWLGVRVRPPAQKRHTTYRLDDRPRIGTLWTYAEPENDGTGDYRHVGGGTYDADTNTWSQGAFNADDMTRAAVVYLRHWQSTGDRSSRRAAYHMLRGVAYLQTASGPDAGNVVLWMQPDGTLNPSAEPIELPDPSDSDASYWVARTIWALGEGYAAFRKQDPAFASFLRDRLELSIDAVDRQVLDRYGEYLRIDGQRAPAWLIVDGADATAEAILGLNAYVDAGGSRKARTVLSKLAEGVAALAGGNKQSWPFGALRPWALSRSVYHAWASQMPAALAQASVVLGDRGLAAPAKVDSFTFDPWLLTSGGADQGRLPTRGDASQIAYGVDSRIQSLLATADATGRDAGRRMAGIFAAWYFGANQADDAMYDPSTGRTFDGISAEGDINRNSGAESTIHGLLSMIALDQNPDIAALARTSVIDKRVGTRTLQAEKASLRRDATVVEPDDLWTGESLFGGSGYVELVRGGTASFALRHARRSLILPVFDLEPGSNAVTKFRARGRSLGKVHSGSIGRQGASPAQGALLPVTLPKTLPGGPSRLTATASRARAVGPAKLDAVLLEPLVSRVVLSGRKHGTALLSSASERRQRARVAVAGLGPARVESYDGRGRLVDVRVRTGRTVPVTVPAGGFTFVRR
ncbi:MAG: hypothetical protein M3455_02930 [Actinomycetota bacterium]|nr:hypothetical protein [Actinomycetota bacterium]